jgi:hypothetical protein
LGSGDRSTDGFELKGISVHASLQKAKSGKTVAIGRFSPKLENSTGKIVAIRRSFPKLEAPKPEHLPSRKFVLVD